MLLVGDVGATKTDVAILAHASSPRSFLARRRFRSADYRSLTEIARQVMAEVGAPVTHACFDVAGPVVEGSARLTNLPWEVSEQTLRHELELEQAWVINDLVAMAHALPLLQPGDLHALSAGRPVKGGAIAVIAPGTGLGEAFVVWDGTMYRGYPSEGGHADFAPTNAAQFALLRYLQERFGHVSYELVCSGLGIPHLYDFFRDSRHAQESPALAAQLSAAKDRTPLIIEHAMHGRSADPLCAAALDTFVCALGAEAGNLALKVLATGGVFIGGGIAPRIVPKLDDGHFIAAFRSKGRFSELLSHVPVHVIKVDDAALIGAASYGLAQAACSATLQAGKERFVD